MCQEKAIDSGYHFQHPSAGGLGRGEVQVDQLLETEGADKLKLSFPLTPRKKINKQILCFVLYIIDSKPGTGGSLYNCLGMRAALLPLTVLSGGR